MAQSAHLTRPISDVEVRGRAPKSFMSRATSHEVGGDAGGAVVASEAAEGEGMSHEKGETGCGGGFRRTLIMVEHKQLDNSEFTRLYITCPPSTMATNAYNKKRGYSYIIYRSTDNLTA